MLNKLRDSLQPTMTKLGTSFASTGLSANFWTGVGLSISVAAGIAYATPSFLNIDWYSSVIVASVLLLISGFFDIVDGSVARVTKQASKRGAFLDSSFDKISEVVIFAGIAFGGLVDPFWCLVALGISILVSYTRARAESLGVELKGVGIGERAERMLILAIIGMIPLHLIVHSESELFNRGIYWAVILVSIVAGITLIQRIAATAKRLSST
ncbi:MAG TPA: CDP-alcohol phosphatidyltransferase family protein [Nitrososphaera sp.]|nr:CDP-alcohol phosphatidyltransferase family protein [Nitrososphaera sp.]